MAVRYSNLSRGSCKGRAPGEVTRLPLQPYKPQWGCHTDPGSQALGDGDSPSIVTQFPIPRLARPGGKILSEAERTPPGHSLPLQKGQARKEPQGTFLPLISATHMEKGRSKKEKKKRKNNTEKCPLLPTSSGS